VVINGAIDISSASKEGPKHILALKYDQEKEGGAFQSDQNQAEDCDLSQFARGIRTGPKSQREHRGFCENSRVGENYFCCYD